MKPKLWNFESELGCLWNQNVFLEHVNNQYVHKFHIIFLTNLELMTR